MINWLNSPERLLAFNKDRNIPHHVTWNSYWCFHDFLNFLKKILLSWFFKLLLWYWLSLKIDTFRNMAWLVSHIWRNVNKWKSKTIALVLKIKFLRAEYLDIGLGLWREVSKNQFEKLLWSFLLFEVVHCWDDSCFSSGYSIIVLFSRLLLLANLGFETLYLAVAQDKINFDFVQNKQATDRHWKLGFDWCFFIICVSLMNHHVSIPLRN